MLRKAKELEHYELRARDGRIGHVQDFFFDDRHWTVRYLVVDTGTWLDSRKVLISPVAVESTGWDERLIAVNLTQAQVRNSPGIDTEQPVSREHEAALMQYYNWPAYWGSVGFPDVGFAMPTVSPEMSGATMREDPTLRSHRVHERGQVATVHKDYHLRSVRAVTDHAIEATDGRIGHVDDFLIDEQTWEIRYLVVDTRNWWPGRKVVIAPQWICEVGWDKATVYVDLTRAAVKASPAYDPSKPFTSGHAGPLHDHYERPRHSAG